jgi:putative ABC transport system permease protein
MEVPFVFVTAQAAGAAGAALLITVALGLAGTLTALNRKPAAVLRNL